MDQGVPDQLRIRKDAWHFSCARRRSDAEPEIIRLGHAYRRAEGLLASPVHPWPVSRPKREAGEDLDSLT